jgi:acyl-CoA synthetase (NDP forming)
MEGFDFQEIFIMKKFFYPENTAIIGVSDKPSNLGKNIITNLKEFGFTGSYEAVGREGGTLFDKPIYKSVLDVPHDLDLAMILVRAEVVPLVAEMCGQKGIKRLVISTGGFSEYRPERKELEENLLDICQKYGMRFIGPNCLAVINMENGLFLPFSPYQSAKWKKGPVSIISQSGGIATTLSQHLSYHKIGVSKVASIGNKLNVDEVDLLQFFLDDPETKIIYMYLEGLPRARELYEMGCAADKPILIHKSNTSASSHGIARSHTASLASDDTVVEAAFRQAGVIRVHSLEEAIDCIKMLGLPPLKGDRLACIACGGGASVMVTDEADRNGFTLPSYPQDFLDWLHENGRAKVITVTNPIDYGDLYELDLHIGALERMRKLPDIDAVFYDMNYNEEWEKVVLSGGFQKLFDYLSRANEGSDIPVIVRPNLADLETRDSVNKRITAPLFETIPGCFQAMKKIREARQAKRLPNPPAKSAVSAASAVETILREAIRQDKTFLDYEGYGILKALSIPVVRQQLFPREAADKISGDAEKIKYPVALKALGSDLAHKTDVGGVRLNISDYEELSKALAAMAADVRLKSATGFLVQEMVDGGVEVIVGGKRDPQFGPVVMVGLGGIFVELFADFQLAVAPVDMTMAGHMIQSLRGYPLLQGYRGAPPMDIESIAMLIKHISDLMANFPSISEIDLNPVRVFPQGEGSLVIDCKVFL